jgi:hypothetical protein
MISDFGRSTERVTSAHVRAAARAYRGGDQREHPKNRGGQRDSERAKSDVANHAGPGTHEPIFPVKQQSCTERGGRRDRSGPAQSTTREEERKGQCRQLDDETRDAQRSFENLKADVRLKKTFVSTRSTEFIL